MKVKDSYNVDTVAVAAATAAISDQQYHKETVAKVKRDRELLTAQLRALGFTVPNSNSNFVLARSKDVEASRIYEALVGRNIYVRYFDAAGLEDKLRITVGTSEQNDALVLALKEILREQG